MIVAIHQPNFFPWLGYFDKINKSDIFVFMDDVAYPKSSKSSGSWTNRVNILVQGNAKWIQCPIIKEHGEQIIKDVEINNQINWRDAIRKTIDFNYKKAAYYKEIMLYFEKMLYQNERLLGKYNINNIHAICELLGIKKQFILQSEINTTLKSTELLIEIVKNVKGNSYLCGGGASGYQDDEMIKQNGIDLKYQTFNHPTYNQRGNDFVQGLSIIDALFYCGVEGTKALLEQESRNSDEAEEK